MSIWRIDVYDKKNDETPSKTGYVEAASEENAVGAAASAMGDAERADLEPIRKATKVTSLPEDKVIWTN